MEWAVWKVLEGMVDMDEMDGMEGMDGIPCKDTNFIWYCQIWGWVREMFEMCFQIESSSTSLLIGLWVTTHSFMGRNS